MYRIVFIVFVVLFISINSYADSLLVFDNVIYYYNYPFNADYLIVCNDHYCTYDVFQFNFEKLMLE